MSVEAELFTSIKALYTADSGAGGLNGSGSANVPFFLWDNDANSTANQNVPRIVVEILESTADGFVNGVSVMPFKMHLWFNANIEQASLNASAVVARLRTVYHRVALASGSVWSFSPPTLRRNVQSGLGRKSIEWHTVATKLSGV